MLKDIMEDMKERHRKMRRIESIRVSFSIDGIGCSKDFRVSDSRFGDQQPPAWGNSERDSKRFAAKLKKLGFRVEIRTVAEEWSAIQ